MANCVLVIHGGERIAVAESYAEVVAWFNQNAGRHEARQFQSVRSFPNDPPVTIASTHIVAVIGERE